MMKKLYMLILLGLGTNLWAQDIDKIENKNEEQAYIHINSNVLLPGETLNYVYYNLLSSNHIFSDLSKIAYVKLINSNGDEIFSHVVTLENAKGYSDWLIPSTLAGGTYNLVGYTKWMQNFSQAEYYQVPVVILNPYQINDDKTFAFEEIDFKNATISSGNLSIKLDKQVFGKRESVKAQLNGWDENYKLSISVRKLDSLINLPVMQATELKTRNSSQFKFISNPEFEGRLIKGTVENGNNSNITVAVPEMGSQFRTYKLDENGNFEISIPFSQDYSTAYLDILEENEEEPGITIIEDELTLPDFILPDVKINGNQGAALKQRALFAQIEQSYREAKNDSIMNQMSPKAFYGSRGIEYILDDFTRFTTMAETFVEIINYISFRGKENAHYINVSGLSNDTNFGDKPLVLVDGLRVNDHEYIYNLDPKTVKSIHVIRDKYFLGGATYQGVVDIITFNTEVSPALTINKFGLELEKPEVKKVYYSENYSSENQKIRKKRIPDYRYQLLWLPILEKPEFEFFTSDVEGIYEINIQGFQSNGKAISISKTFEVN